VFERYATCPVKGFPLYRGLVEEPERGSFPGTFERKENYIWVPFLDPEAIKFLSLVRL